MRLKQQAVKSFEFRGSHVSTPRYHLQSLRDLVRIDRGEGSRWFERSEYHR